MAGTKKGAKAKSKTKKDPNAPKKPKTVYLLFCDDHREKLSKELGIKNAALLSKELGKRWKEIDPAEKKKYEEMYERAKKEYDKEFAEYQKNKPESESESESESDSDSDKGKKKRKAPKKKKDPNAPKQPPTAYLIFCSENRAKVKAENKDLSMIEVTKKLSEQWRALDDDGKQKYNQMAAQQKAEYEKKMQIYKKSQGVSEPANKKRKVEEEDEESEEDGSDDEDEEDSGDE
jgi:hypothetical protein